VADAQQGSAGNVPHAGGLNHNRGGGDLRQSAGYQSRLSWVTNPSSVARQGTIAGTQVRPSSSSDPILIGRKSIDRATSSAVGQSVSGMGCLIGLANFHMSDGHFNILECTGRARLERKRPRLPCSTSEPSECKRGRLRSSRAAFRSLSLPVRTLAVLNYLMNRLGESFD
jgi:hypothetical protein